MIVCDKCRSKKGPFVKLKTDTVFLGDITVAELCQKCYGELGEWLKGEKPMVDSDFDIRDEEGNLIDRYVKESDMIERFQLLQDQIDDLEEKYGSE